MPARILAIQNAQWEGPGLIEQYSRAAGLRLTTVELFRRGGRIQAIPFERLERDGFSAVVSLGSPATAYRPETNPRHEELVSLFKLVRRRKIPSFQICYSMQLFCITHGGKVIKNPMGKEIGFKRITLTTEGRLDRVVGPTGDHATLEWHGDVVQQLPDGATRLASSDVTENQIAVLDGIHYLFQSDGQAATASMVREWLRRDGEWATKGTGVRATDLLREAIANEVFLRNAFLTIFANFVGLALSKAAARETVSG